MFRVRVPCARWSTRLRDFRNGGGERERVEGFVAGMRYLPGQVGGRQDVRVVVVVVVVGE